MFSFRQPTGMMSPGVVPFDDGDTRGAKEKAEEEEKEEKEILCASKDDLGMLVLFGVFGLTGRERDRERRHEKRGKVV